MVETAEYREWLVTAPTRRGVIETIHVYHPALGDTYLANWDVDIIAIIQDNGPDYNALFTATRFDLAPSEINDGTEQGTTIGISSFDGLIYGQLKSLTPQQRVDDPITITPRFYHTDDFTKQLINPAPVWNVHNVSVSMQSVMAELKALPLRIHKTGRYFTALEFPVLALSR